LGLLFNIANLQGFDDEAPTQDFPSDTFESERSPSIITAPTSADTEVHESSAEASEPRFTLDISDGSRLVCSGAHDLAIPLTTQFGEVAIPLRLIQSIHFWKDHKTAVAQLLNKDRLTGTLGNQPLKVITAMGEIAVPTNVIVRLEIQRGEFDADAPNYESDHFSPEPEPQFNATTIPRRVKKTPRILIYENDKNDNSGY
jgi:hypothetical protein